MCLSLFSLYLSFFILLDTAAIYTLMRAAKFKPFRTPPQCNHVITRIKRSLLVGTNLISEFPAANYLCRRWSPAVDRGRMSRERANATRRAAPRHAAPSQFKTISEITPCGTRSEQPPMRLFSSSMRRKTAQNSWISSPRN